MRFDIAGSMFDWLIFMVIFFLSLFQMQQISTKVYTKPFIFYEKNIFVIAFIGYLQCIFS